MKSLIFLLFFCSPLAWPRQSETALKSSPEDFLKTSLQNYEAEFLEIKVKQEIFLSMIKTSLNSEGSLALSKEQFRLDLNGNPSSLSVFDGKTFWHQADKQEKIVFKFNQIQSFQKLSTFLNYESLLKNFKITSFKNQQKTHIYQLWPKNSSPLKSIYLKTDTQYLVEIRLNWKDLNNWQRYRLSKPLIKKVNDKANSLLFTFQTVDFKVIERTDKIEI